MDEDKLRDAVLSAVEASLDAQLRAVRRLRRGEPRLRQPRASRMSHVDMAYDVLKRARTPLHASELMARIRQTFGVEIDRESLVSALSKKIARGDRFQRTDKNTFALKGESR